MKPNQLFQQVWMRSILFIWLVTIACISIMQSQGTIRGSIGKSDISSDSSKVFIYGKSGTTLDQVVFENINFCISIPDQGDNNPGVMITQNFIPSLDWTYAGSDYPDVINGRAYYTFIGNDNESGIRINWPMNTEMPIVELKFTGGNEKVKIQLNDLTTADGVGFGGGPSLQSFWYVQLNEIGDATDYEEKYFQSSGSQDPENGGVTASSNVESEDEIALPVLDLASLGWQLFPNPTFGRIHLIPGVTGKTQIRFYDLAGKLLEQEKREIHKGLATTFDCSYFPEGILLVQVSSEDGGLLFSKKIIVNSH